MSEAAPAEYLDEAPLDGATTPTFYGTGRSKEQWSPTKVTACSQVGISGGFNMKPFSCPVMKLDCPPHGELLFVETSINAPWFRHGIAGKSAPDKGGISSAVQVLADMHRWLDDTIAAPVAGERPPSASESQGDSQEPVRNEGQDPMDELDALTPAPAERHPHRKGAPRKKVPRSECCEMPVPTRPACAPGPSGEHGPQTNIRVYRPAKRKHANIWICTESINWLLAYAADEHHYQGIAQEDDQPEPNVPAVAGLRLDWDLERRGYVGEFIRGPMKGTKRSMTLSQIDEDSWNTVCDHHPDFAKGLPSFLRANRSQKKAVIMKFVPLWCAAVASGNAGQWQAELSLANRGTKRSLRHDMDAAEEDDGYEVPDVGALDAAVEAQDAGVTVGTEADAELFS